MENVIIIVLIMGKWLPFMDLADYVLSSFPTVGLKQRQATPHAAVRERKIRLDDGDYLIKF